MEQATQAMEATETMALSSSNFLTEHRGFCQEQRIGPTPQLIFVCPTALMDLYQINK
jgi:hypothetical protein